MKPVDRVERGTFLIASPVLRDPNFIHTVVLMCEHGEEGSWGLVVNRRTDLLLGDLLEDVTFPVGPVCPVHWGGPVETSRMQVLHRLRRGIEGELEICAGVSLGLDVDELRRTCGRTLLPGEAVHAYVGHAGWGAGQLDAELETSSWITCTAEARIVFETKPDEMWDRVLTSLGSGFAGLTRVPIDPRLN